jgi:folate-binding protein YgfZ
LNQSYDRLAQHSDPHGSLCTALSSYRIIEVSGPDTEKFLQGQLSCDMRKLAELGHLPGSHCNIKGHMISLFRLFYLNPQKIWLRVHDSIAQSAFDNLKKYSIFSKVTLRFADELSGVAVDAANSRKLCIGFEVKEDHKSLYVKEDSLIAVYDDALYEVWAQDNILLTCLEAGKLKGTPESHWDLANIERGLVDLRAETQEHFIPQMTNLQAVDGVSFNKGCYTGQEIVTRLQHRGILKKAMYRFSASSVEAVAPGSELLNSEGVTVGEAVLAASTDSETQLLAVVQQAQIDAGETLRLPSGTELSFKGLPYELDPMLFEKKR